MKETQTMHDDELLELFVIGDSISMHYGPYLERSVAGSFHYARKTGEEPFLTGGAAKNMNGGDSVRVREYVELWAESNPDPVDVLLLNCGLHDIKASGKSRENQVSLGAYEENLIRVVKVSLSIAKKVVWIRSTPVVDEIHNKPGMEFNRYREDIDRYNGVADTIMRIRGIPVIDLHAFTLSLGAPEAIFCDHVHFTERVRELHGAYIAGYLASLDLDG